VSCTLWKQAADNHAEVHSGDTDYWNTRRRSIVLAAPFSVAPDSTGNGSTTAAALVDRPLGHSTVHTFATASSCSDADTASGIAGNTEAAVVVNGDCVHAEQQQQQQPHAGRKMSISTSCCALPLSAFEHTTSTATTATTANNTAAAAASANTVTSAQLRRESLGDECITSAAVSSGNGRKGGSRRRSLSSGNLHGLVHLPDF
jgi:hypothetical protein